MSRALSVLLLALTLATGCSSAALTRRTLPAALADHLNSLPGFESREHVIVPEGLAWNVAMAQIRGRAPIARVDPASLLVQTYHHYETGLSNGVNEQTRYRFDVVFGRDARLGLRSQSTQTIERRRRGSCDPAPSPWTPPAPHDTNLDGDIAAAIGALGDVPPESFVFEAAPAALAQQLAQGEQVYLATVGYGADGSPFVDAIGRESAAVRRDVQIQVRSGYHADFVAAEGGTRVLVHGTLEHRTVEEDGTASEWASDQAARVENGVYGALAALAPVRDLRLPDVQLDLSVEAQPYEPDVAAPAENLRGSFVVAAAFTAMPGRRGDPTFWQYATAVNVVVDLADQRLVFDPVSPYAASGFIARTASANLDGDTPVTLSLANGDPAAGGRTIPYATVNASQLVAACGPVCFDSDGGNVCLLVHRP